MAPNDFVQDILRLAGLDRWRRIGGPPTFLIVWCALASVFLGVFLWGMVSIAGGVFIAIPELRERPLRKLADEAAGPGVFHGALRGTERLTPLGDPAVGWYAWVDRVTKGKNSSRIRVCTASQVDGMRLENGSRVLDLDLPVDRLYVAEPNGISEPTPGRIAVLAESTQANTPAAMLQRPECNVPPDANFEYHQIAWSSGRDVVVSGCREGDLLAPCGDRADFMASYCEIESKRGTCVDAREGVDAMLHHLQGGTKWAAGFVCLLVGTFLGVLGGVNLRRHRTLQRRRRTIAGVE